MYACIPPPILAILPCNKECAHDESGLVNNRLLVMMSYLNLLVLHIKIKYKNYLNKYNLRLIKNEFT